jgi:hypothetical protein
VQRCINECQRQLLVIGAQVATEKSAAGLCDVHVHTALQHASDTVTASLYVAMHFARCNVAIVSRIFQKYPDAVACAAREGCTGITQQFLEQQFLQDACSDLLQELRVVLSPPPHMTECIPQELLEPSSSARQSTQPPSPARSTLGSRARGDSNAVLQAARAHNLPLVASISGGSSAALTGAVKSAVETNDAVALGVLLSTATVTGSPRCASRHTQLALSVTRLHSPSHACTLRHTLALSVTRLHSPSHACTLRHTLALSVTRAPSPLAATAPRSRHAVRPPPLLPPAAW